MDMLCIKCSSATRVTNSRPHKKTPGVWRRRTCTSCGATFTTHERLSDSHYLFTVVKAGKHHRFSLPVLMVSIFQSLAHLPLAEASEESYWLAQTIAEGIQASAHNTVSSSQLSQETYDVLVRYDEVAAAFYGLRHRITTKTPAKGSKRFR